MANYTVEIWADPETDTIEVLGGGSSGSRIELEEGDTLTVEHINLGIGGASVTITVGTFSSAFWTSTTSMSLAKGASATRTIKTSPTYSTFSLNCSSSGYTSGTIYLETVEPPPPISASKPNAFTVASISGVPTGQEVNFETVSVTGNTASATSRVTGGVLQRKSSTGTWTTSDITVNAGDSVYLKATSSSSYSTAISYTLRIGDLSGTNGENYDWETASFSLTTESDPGTGQTLNFPISSGTISMRDIIEFFHYPVGVVPTPANSLSDYYRGGTYVPNVTGNSSIPTSGTIALSNFYGSETRWYVTAPSPFYREVNTLSGPSSFTLTFTVYAALFGGGYAPDVGRNSQFRNDSIVEVWSNNDNTLNVTGGSSTYTGDWSMTVSMTVSANQEQEFYGYIPVDARSRVDNSITQTGLRVYFWFFFYGP